MTYSGKHIAFQKCLFWSAKQALLQGKTGTFEDQNNLYWQVVDTEAVGKGAKTALLKAWAQHVKRRLQEG